MVRKKGDPRGHHPNDSNGHRLPLATEWRPIFLRVLRDTGIVRLAAEAAGVARQSAYRARDASPEFAAQWERATTESTELLVAEARKRALNGSDALLIFLLRAHGGPEYLNAGPRTTQILNQPGATVNVGEWTVDIDLREGEE